MLCILHCVHRSQRKSTESQERIGFAKVNAKKMGEIIKSKFMVVYRKGAYFANEKTKITKLINKIYTLLIAE